MGSLEFLNDVEDYENEQMIAEMVDIDTMLNTFVDHGVLDEVSGDYGVDIRKLCNNVTMYIYMYGKSLFGPMLTDHLKIHSGAFDGLDHAWMSLGDVIIDGSLAQFVDGVPAIALVRGDCERYQSYREMNAEEYEAFLNEEV